jgi:alpha-1,3-glucosyltransferase
MLHFKYAISRNFSTLSLSTRMQRLYQTAVLCRGYKDRANTVKAAVLCFGSIPLLMVDHIHFQYNGMLLGVLIASLAAETQGHVLVGGALFAALLNLKHLYLILAPVQFIYIFRGWVWGSGWAARLISMGATVVLVFAASLGPIVATGQVLPMLQRHFTDS